VTKTEKIVIGLQGLFVTLVMVVSTAYEFTWLGFWLAVGFGLMTVPCFVPDRHMARMRRAVVDAFTGPSVPTASPLTELRSLVKNDLRTQTIVLFVGVLLALVVWITAPTQYDTDDKKIQERIAIGLAVVTGLAVWQMRQQAKP